MRPIDADKFEEFIRENCTDSLVDLWCELVRRQPTIEAVPVVHGEWLDVTPRGKTKRWKFDGVYKCTNCEKMYEDNRYNFCPNCGCCMKGGA